MFTSDDIEAQAFYLSGGNISLLTHEEECVLGNIIQSSLPNEERLEEILEEIRSIEKAKGKLAPRLVREKERLLQLLKPAIEAKQELVSRNRRLVVSIARHFACRSSSIPLGDLFPEGTIGLLIAAKKFKPEKGFRFATYATWWVRQTIQRALDNTDKIVRIPAHVAKLMRTCYFTKTNMAARLGRDPSLKELAFEVGLPVEEVKRLEQIDKGIISLEAIIQEEAEFSFTDVIKDEKQPELGSAHEMSLLKEALEQVIKRLRPKERVIINLRYGFEDGCPRTLREIGDRLGISKERVRQIENKVLRSMGEYEEILAFKKCS